MKEQLSSPDNVNEMNIEEIAEMFYEKVDTDLLAEQPDIVEKNRFGLDK